MRTPTLLAISYLISSISGTQYTVYNFPSLSNADSLEFYYLEAPFPYNAPASIIDAAGTDFTRYGIAHAGLGIWDTTTNDKYSIEFVSTNYVGSLLPSVSGGTLSWQNAGEVVVTTPLDDNNWINARYIASGSGSAYTQLIAYIQDKLDTTYQYYQPVTGIYVNISKVNFSLIETTGSLQVNSDNVNNIGDVQIAAVDSFAFVDDLVGQLNEYGSNVGSFLQIYATSFDYFLKTDVKPSLITWNTANNANTQVLQWFTALYNCYYSAFELTKLVNSGSSASTTAAGSVGGAQYFFTLIKSCYESSPYAYIYASPLSVYNVTLANFTADIQTLVSSAQTTAVIVKEKSSSSSGGKNKKGGGRGGRWQTSHVIHQRSASQTAASLQTTQQQLQTGTSPKLYLQAMTTSGNGIATISASEANIYRTPYQSQYIYTLPTGGEGHAEQLAVMDYIMIALLAIAFLVGCGYFLIRLFSKKQRRRVSFEGDRVAVRVVENLINSNANAVTTTASFSGPGGGTGTAGGGASGGGGGYGMDNDDLMMMDHEDRTYFHGRGKAPSFFTRLTGQYQQQHPSQRARYTSTGRRGTDNPLREFNAGSLMQQQNHPYTHDCDSTASSQSNTLEKPLTGNLEPGECRLDNVVASDSSSGDSTKELLPAATATTITGRRQQQVQQQQGQSQHGRRQPLATSESQDEEEEERVQV